MAQEQLPFLRFLPHASQKQLQCILKTITKDQLNAIGEVCYNILYGVVEVEHLRRYQDIIRILGDKKVSQKKRRSTLRSNPRVVVKLIEALLP